MRAARQVPSRPQNLKRPQPLASRRQRGTIRAIAQHSEAAIPRRLFAWWPTAACAVIGSFPPTLGHVARRNRTSGDFMLRLATVLTALALALMVTPLVASAQAPSLTWGSQVNPSRCPTDQG